MEPIASDNKEVHPIAARLLQVLQRYENDWGKIATCAPGKVDKEIANEFLLCSLLDYRINADDAWARGERYFNSLGHEDKRELWQMIARTPLQVWTSEEMFQRCRLHWMRPAHNRLWPIANNICVFFDGDATKTWEGASLFDVFCRLYYIGAGEQISRMIVGALKDCGHISGRGDVKADSHVCRVLGRVFKGEQVSPVIAVETARKLYPDDPWQLDAPLRMLGSSICRPASPQCPKCYLVLQCKFAQSRQAESGGRAEHLRG